MDHTLINKSGMLLALLECLSEIKLGETCIPLASESDYYSPRDLAKFESGRLSAM